MFVIILSIVSFCIESMEVSKNYKQTIVNLEYFYCIVFTSEFILRLACCPSLKKFLESAMTWIDFISTIQFYIKFCSDSDSVDFLLVFRLIRICRLFRFFRNLTGMQVIVHTLKASANELFLLALIVLIPMVIFSTLMYYAEKVCNAVN